MNPQPFVVTPGAYARALNVAGEKITVLAANSATQSYEIFLQQGDEGTGPPPHSHDWDESFYVIKGNVEVTCGDNTVVATPGTLVHVPAGTTHAFHFMQGGGEMISISGRNSRAAELFTAIDREVPAGPLDIPKLIAVVRKCGITVDI